MPALLSVHLPDQAIAQHVLPNGTIWVVGREYDCDLVIAHDSVSRHHARLWQRDDASWGIDDLGSKNGLRIDGARTASATLHVQEWFALGDVFFEFRLLDEQGNQCLSESAQRKRQNSTAWNERLKPAADAEALLRTVLSGIVELAECERGFLLTAGSAGQLQVRVCAAIEPDELDGSTFAGSRSAISRAMRDRKPVFLSDRPECAWLHDQASVVGQGIRALVALPLIHDGLLLGVAYTDTKKSEKIFTELDAELLSAFADRAAMSLAAADLEASLARMESWLRVDASVTAGGDGAKQGNRAT